MSTLIDYSNKITIHKNKKRYNNYLVEFISYSLKENYNPYISESYRFLYKILKNKNFSISQFIKQFNYTLISENCYYLTSDRNHYIIKYCINEKSLKLEYEFLLYNILNKYCSNINNFPEVPLFFKEITKYKTKNKNKSVFGYIVKLPNLKLSVNSKSSLLKEYFDKNRISNVRSIINIILQLVSSLQLAKNSINFQFNDCNLNNIFCFNIESSSSLTKYLKYKLSNFGDIVVRCKYFLIPLHLQYSTIDFRFFKELFPSNSNSLQLLKNYIQNLSGINYSLINNKVTVEINDCYQIITEIFNQIKENYKIKGSKDEKIILSYLFNWWFNYYNLQSSKKNKYNKLMNNLEDILNNYDILTKFHEVGMFSGKFPSNSKVELYNYEYNGIMIQNKLTSSDILYSQISKLHSENNQQPNLGNELQL